MSCDNLVANGPFLRKLVTDYFEALGKVPDVFEATRFPASMVDRIVPATTEADREEAARLLGVRDEAVVVAEPFLQWVIEDDFAGDRPAWERGGAVLTADVAPWEQAKLRMLNATHSMLAYLGALRGYETIAEAVQDEELSTLARALMTEDVVPTLTPPDGLDLAEYGASVLERFANPALKHRTTQVAMDGSVKLPVRMLGTVRDRLAAGAEPQVISLAVAAWMVYVRETPTVDDPQARPAEGRARGASSRPPWSTRCWAWIPSSRPTCATQRCSASCWSSTSAHCRQHAGSVQDRLPDRERARGVLTGLAPLLGGVPLAGLLEPLGGQAVEDVGVAVQRDLAGRDDGAGVLHHAGRGGAAAHRHLVAGDNDVAEHVRSPRAGAAGAGLDRDAVHVVRDHVVADLHVRRRVDVDPAAVPQRRPRAAAGAEAVAADRVVLDHAVAADLVADPVRRVVEDLVAVERAAVVVRVAPQPDAAVVLDQVRRSPSRRSTTWS